MNYAIITPAEADDYLATYADWLALDDALKTEYISKASVYVQTQWTCTEVDFDDETTIPEEVKEATAYYAYAEFNGNLYGDGGQVNEGQLESKDVTAGDVSVAKSYYKGYNSNASSSVSGTLAYPDTLMATQCTANNTTGAQELTRV